MSSRTAKTKFQRFIRLAPAIAVPGIGFGLLLNITDLKSFTGKPLLDMLLVAAAMNFLFYLAIRIASGLSKKSQFWVLGLFVSLQILMLACVKLDGLYGNGRPVLAWRFSTRSNIEANTASNVVSKLAEPLSLHPHGLDSSSFRGAFRDGVIDRKLTDWKQAPPVERWRIDTGEGWSSIVTCGNYCFMLEQRGEDEVVVCRDLSTGEECWLHRDAAIFAEVSGGNGPRATPTVADGMLYSLGATGILNCLNASDGSVVWALNILDDNEAKNLLFGVTSSPLIYNGLCIVCAGGEAASMVAYERLTGEKIWAAGSAKASYSSPQISKLCGKEQVLIFNAEGLDGHDPTSGELLWHVPWANQSPDGTNVCQPIVLEGNRIFISSGYEAGCAVYQLNSTDGKYTATEVWKSRFLNSKFASAVLHGQFVFGLDNGIMCCIDTKTGRRKWKGGRMGHGQLLLIDDKILVQTEKGDIAIVEASSRSFSEIARLKAFNRRTWTVPTIAKNLLLIRNDREAICFEIAFEN